MDGSRIRFVYMHCEWGHMLKACSWPRWSETNHGAIAREKRKLCKNINTNKSTKRIIVTPKLFFHFCLCYEDMKRPPVTDFVPWFYNEFTLINTCFIIGVWSFPWRNSRSRYERTREARAALKDGTKVAFKPGHVPILGIAQCEKNGRLQSEETSKRKMQRSKTYSPGRVNQLGLIKIFLSIHCTNADAATAVRRPRQESNMHRRELCDLHLWICGWSN